MAETDIYKIKLGSDTYNLPFLPLSGGTLSGDLTFGRNNTDAFINFNHLDGSSSSWRIGYLGTGSSNANYLVFESTDGNGTGEWKRAFQLGCYNHDATFSGTVSSSKFIGNLQGNADSASYASTIACTSTLDNIARPIVLTSENNKLYYTSKAKINYSDGSLSCGPISSVSLSTTGPISITGTTAETAALKFSRSGASTWNYIIWPGNTNSDCKLAFGYGTSSANSYYYMTKDAIYPTATNIQTLGTSSLKWSNVYATTFTGNLAGTADLANSVVCSVASTDIFRPILVTNESNGILYSSKAKLNYSTGAISCGPISSGDIVAGNITTSGNITLNGNIGIYGSNNSGKGILASMSSSNTWDGISGYACTVVGSITAPTVLRSSSDDLFHYNSNNGAKYKIFDENNLSKSSIGLGNVQNTAFYARQATVNGTTWGLAGTTNSLSTFTIWAPTGTGAAGQFLQSTGAEPQWVSDIKLSNSSGGDSPRLIFERGNSSDSTYDWDIYVKSGGSLKIRRNASGTWNEIMSLYNDNNTIVANWPIVGSLTGNADSATYATTAGTANTLSLGAGTSDVADSTYILTSHVDGWNASTQVYSRPATNLFNYINTKISGAYLPKTGGAITGDLTLYNSGTGNSPALIFQRDRIDNYDSYLDWKIFDSTGNLHFQNNYGDWHDSFVLNYIDNSATLGGNTVYTSGNLTKSTLGLGNVQNTAFYKRVVTINGSGWDMAGTNSNSAFSIYAPDAPGTTGQILKSTGGTPAWINQSDITAGSATLASTVNCIQATSSNTRPIVGTNTSNSLYYSNLATVRWDTGEIGCGGINFNNDTVGGNSLIKIPSANVATKIFRVYSSDSTYAEKGVYGFDLTYTGNETGNDNKLVLRSDNQNSATQIDAMTVYQDGNITFANTPKVGSTAISLSNHNHDQQYVKVLGAGSYNPLGAYVRSINVDGSSYDFLSPYSSNGITITTTNVLQEASTTANYRPILLGANNSTNGTGLTTSITSKAYTCNNLFVQPSTGCLVSKADVTLLSDSGASPKLRFIRGGAVGDSGALWDWQMYSDAGHFYLQTDQGKNSWLTPLYISTGNTIGIYKTNPGYTFDVNGSANATTLYENGTRVSLSGHTHTKSQITDFAHSHDYLPLTGGTLSGNLTLMAANGHNTDQYINFKYSTGDLDNYSWRIGYIGTGSGNDNKLVFQSNGNGSWQDALTFGLTDLTAIFTNTPKVGTTKVSLEGHSHTSFPASIAVTGKVSATQGFYEESDSRLKDIEKPLEVDFNDLAKLQKIYFKFKSKPDKTEIGIIAQEVQEIYPEIVSENEDGNLTVAYDKLAVIALAAVDKLNERLERIEKLLSI